MVKFKSVYLWVFLFLLATISWKISVASPIEPEPWVAAAPGHLVSTWDRLGDQLSEAIFDGINDIDLYNFNSSDYKAKLSIHRRIFDNADILNSWTVVDHFTIAGSIPILTFTDIFSGIFNFGTFGASINSNLGMDFINIRQVSAKNYHQFPSIDHLLKEYQEQPWLNEFVLQRDSFQESAQSEDVPNKDPGVWVAPSVESVPNHSAHKNWSFVPKDPENKARYSKLWNMLTFPFRLPIKSQHLSRLDNGEIISYLGSGSIQTAAHAGWNIDPTNLSGVANAGVSISVFVSGTYRISILKENDRYVKVKVARIATLGNGVTLGSDYKTNLIDGLFLISGLKSNSQVIPFSLNVSSAIARSFDLGYRYDMTVSAAREAFENAVQGRFYDSEALAFAANEIPTDFSVSGVQRVFERHAQSTQFSSAQKMRLGFIWRNNNNTSHSNISTLVTLPDGTHHVFSSVTNNNRGWKTVWGNREKFQHHFSVNIDFNVREKTGNLNQSTNLIIEGRYEDASTTIEELKKYAREVEENISKPGLFPEVPGVKKVGKTSFYYQLGIPSNLLQKFIEYPEEKMWSALEASFGACNGCWATPAKRTQYLFETLPLAVPNLLLSGTPYNIHAGSRLSHATDTLRRWKKLKTITDDKKLVEAMGRIFFDRIYSKELVHLIRVVLAGETVPHYAMGSSRAFGRIVSQGNIKIDYDNIATRTKREVDFDTEESRVQDFDPQAVIQDLSSEIVSENKVILKFFLHKKPENFFLQLVLNNSWWPFKNGELAAVLIKNNGLLQPGLNTIVLESSDTAGPWASVAQALVPNKTHEIHVAVSNNGTHWGAVATTRFRLRNSK